MRLPARVVSSILVCTALGCHTIDAGRRLVVPSPAYRLSISSPGPAELEWQARYGESSYPDAIFVALFVRSVDHDGVWRLSEPGAVCTSIGNEVRELSSEPVTIGDLGYAPTREISDSERAAALDLGCTHFLSARPGHRWLEIEGVDLEPATAGPAQHLELPRERPLLDPRRWGWLLVAPALDVATILVLPPALAYAFVCDALDCSG